jgi:IPT/TIG domain
VIIQSDINYKAQPLYAASGPDGAQIQPIPVISGNVAIYLDISERLVTAAEDPSLVLPGLGTESCARMKRVWCVRTRQGTAAPSLNDPDYVAGNAYYLLAVLTRKLSAPNVAAPIQPGDIADKRHKGLTIAALESRVSNLETLLLLPAFGTPGTQLVPSTQFVGQTVALNGRNLTVGTPKVWVGNVSAALSGSPTSTQLNFIVPTLAAGSYSVSLSTDGGGPITATDVLTVKPPAGPPPPPPPNAPTLDATTPFTPTTQARGQNIVITGTNFNQANLTVWFGVTQAVVVNSSAVQITATVPSTAAGNYSISVDTAAGAVSSTAPFPVT